MAQKTIFYNGSVVTCDAANPLAGGFVIEGGLFTEVLSFPSTDLSSLDPRARHIDLKGATVLPGLVESHGHLFLTGLRQCHVDLRGAGSFSEVLRRVSSRAKAVSLGSWIIGEGWDHHEWASGGQASLPGKHEFEALSAAVPNHPVFLTRIDWHAAIVNRSGFLATKASIPLDHEGQQTGLLIDTEMEAVQRCIPAPTCAELAEALSRSLGECARLGVTSFHECGASAEEIAVFQEFRAAGKLTCRMHVMIDGTKKAHRENLLAQKPLLLDIDGVLQVRAVKMFADGALGSRGALLFESYNDADTKGVAIASEDEIAEVSKAALRQGYQMATHAIGDRASHVVLNAYGKALAKSSGAALRWRMEHAQMLIPADVDRMARLGIVASVQCVHCVSDARWVKERLGKRRLEERGYLWRSLLERGIKVINGSDTPVEPMGPFTGMQAAVTRGGLGGNEVMTPAEALAAMTIDAAWAAFMDHEIGSIQIGKRADFIIVDQNPLTCSPDLISTTRVQQTFFAGKQIF